jgi:mannosyltransferase
VNKVLRKPLEGELINYRLLLGFIIALGAALALYKLGSKSLWVDEITTIKISLGSFSAIVESLKHQHNAPPLYYFMLHPFVRLSTGEFMVRLPSAIFSIVSVYACYRVGREFFGKTTGLLAALFLALSPMHLRYAQEARMYSLFELTALLSLFFFYKGVETRQSKFWIGYTFATLASMYTHYFTAFYVATQGTFLLILTAFSCFSSTRSKSIKVADKKTWFAFALSLFAIFLLYLPWLPYALAKTTGKGLHQSFADFLSAIFRCLWVDQAVILPYILAGFGLIGLIGCFVTSQTKKGIFLLLWLTLPLPLIYLFLNHVQSFFAIRYIIFILPVYVLLVAYGVTVSGDALAKFLRRYCRIAVYPQSISLILALLIVSPLSVLSLPRYYKQNKEPSREVGAFLDRHMQPNDIVIIQNNAKSLPFYSNLIAQNCVKSFKFRNKRTRCSPQNAKKNIYKLTHEHSTIWYILMSGSVYPPLGQWIAKRRTVTLIFGGTGSCGDIADIQVFLYRSSWQKDSDALDEGLALIADSQMLWPETFRSDLTLARLYARYHRTTKAIQHYKKALNTVPDRLAVEICLELGALFKQQGNWEEAVEVYHRAVRLRPKRAWYRILLAKALFATRKMEESLGEYKKALALEPRYEKKSWFHVILGDIYCQLGKSNEAVDAYQKALNLNPEDLRTRKKLKRLRP